MLFSCHSNTKELREYFLRSYKPSTASAFESDEGTRTRSSNNAVVTGPYVSETKKNVVATPRALIWGAH